MKIILIVCMLLVGCGWVGSNYDKNEIIAHPTAMNFNCFHPDFYKEMILEYEDSLACKPRPYVSRGPVLAHPVRKWYRCISDEFLNEIMAVLENDINSMDNYTGKNGEAFWDSEVSY